MKKLLSAFLLLLSILALFSACTGKTPDVIAAEEANEVTLDNMTWTLEVEGADVSSYTRADAEKHELSKMTCSMMKSVEPGENGTGSMQTSFLLNGITLREFLEDVGRPDAAKVTYYGKDLYKNDVVFSIEDDLIQSDKVMVGWIMNKTYLLFDSDTYVGVFGAGTLADFTSCTSVSKIVIE